jgi:hypothetical protein
MTISLYIIYLGRVYVLRLAYTWLRPRMHAPLYKSKHIVKVIKNKIYFLWTSFKADIWKVWYKCRPVKNFSELEIGPSYVWSFHVI